MITKANRIELRDEGSRQGYARALDIVGTNFAGTISGDVGTITYSGRELLTAARTYYVRTDGSDSNTGLANSSGGAFATISKAITVIGGLDLGTSAVTIQLGNTGSYAGFTASAPFIGGPGSSVTLLGDTSAPGSYVLTGTANVQNYCSMSFSGVDFTPSSGDGLFVQQSASVTISGACHCGAASGARQIIAARVSTVVLNAVLTVNGSAANWLVATQHAVIHSNGFVHVFSGTPAFSSSTVSGTNGGLVSVVNGTPSGAATGKRYDVTANGVVFTNGGGASFFPGDVAGTTATGGQYV